MELKKFLAHVKQSLSATFHLFGDAHNAQLQYRRRQPKAPPSYLQPLPNQRQRKASPAYLQLVPSHYGGYDMAEKIQRSLANYRR